MAKKSKSKARVGRRRKLSKAQDALIRYWIYKCLEGGDSLPRDELISSVLQLDDTDYNKTLAARIQKKHIEAVIDELCVEVMEMMILREETTEKDAAQANAWWAEELKRQEAEDRAEAEKLTRAKKRAKKRAKSAK